MIKIGDPVKYIGKCDMCTDGTWVIVGRIYVIEVVDNTTFHPTVRLKDKAGIFMQYTFEPSTFELLEKQTKSNIDDEQAINIKIALLDLKRAVCNLKISINNRHRLRY